MSREWMEEIVKEYNQSEKNITWLKENYDVIEIENECESYIHVYPKGSGVKIQERDLRLLTPEEIKLLVEERINNDARP